MNKNLLPLIILSTLIGVLFLFFSDSNTKQNSKANTEKQSNIQSEKQIILNDPIEKVLSSGQEKQLNSTKIINENQLATTQIEDDYQQPFSGISRPSDKAKAILEEAGILPKDLAQEAYVEFDLDSLRTLEVGDTFNLEIPQSLEMYAAEVTKIEKFNNGDKSVFGRLIGSDGVLHTTVLTVGEDAVYGQFTTVSANYVFESKGQYGWIAAKRDLYRNHVEFEAVQVGGITQGPDDVFAPQD